MTRDEYVEKVRAREDLPVFAERLEILRNLARYDGLNVDQKVHRMVARISVFDTADLLMNHRYLRTIHENFGGKRPEFEYYCNFLRHRIEAAIKSGLIPMRFLALRDNV